MPVRDIVFLNVYSTSHIRVLVLVFSYSADFPDDATLARSDDQTSLDGGTGRSPGLSRGPSTTNIEASRLADVDMSASSTPRPVSTAGRVPPRLNRLWTYSSPATTGRNVSCLAWNKNNQVSVQWAMHGHLYSLNKATARLHSSDCVVNFLVPKDQSNMMQWYAVKHRHGWEISNMAARKRSRARRS